MITLSALTATPGYLPGSIEPGPWAVVIGVPNSRPASHHRHSIRITLHETDRPEPRLVLRRGPGWYAGDLHVHSGHSDGRVRAGAHPDEEHDYRIGQPTTVVWARELSEPAIVDGLKSGRVYIRRRGPGGPLLELVAEAGGSTFPMGAVLPAGTASARLRARHRRLAGCWTGFATAKWWRLNGLRVNR